LTGVLEAISGAAARTFETGVAGCAGRRRFTGCIEKSEVETYADARKYTGLSCFQTEPTIGLDTPFRVGRKSRVRAESDPQKRWINEASVGIKANLTRPHCTGSEECLAKPRRTPSEEPSSSNRLLLPPAVLATWRDTSSSPPPPPLDTFRALPTRRGLSFGHFREDRTRGRRMWDKISAGGGLGGCRRLAGVSLAGAEVRHFPRGGGR
jgi:hypothetical protein